MSGTAAVVKKASQTTQATKKEVQKGCCAEDHVAGTPVYKHSPRSDKLKKDLTCRLNRAIGQLNGVKNMIDEDRYCGDVLTQLAAAESAVKAVSRMVMKDHLHTCVVEEIQKGDTEVVDEVMDLLKKFGC